MRVLNQEHQSLALEQLQQLCDEFPNDQMLGEEIRRITEYNAWLKKEHDKWASKRLAKV